MLVCFIVLYVVLQKLKHHQINYGHYAHVFTLFKCEDVVDYMDNLALTAQYGRYRYILTTASHTNAFNLSSHVMLARVYIVGTRKSHNNSIL